MDCEHCGQQISPAAWCRMRRDKYPSLWTAKQAAEQCGCPPNRMGAAMAKLFPRREIRLGPDVHRGKKCALYCVWPSPHNSFFKTLPTKRLRELWRDQHNQHQANRAMADVLAHVERIAAKHV